MNTSIKLICLFFIFMFFCAFKFVNAQAGFTNEFFKTDLSNGFIENKGQFYDQNNKYNPSVLFLLNNSGVNIQLKKNGYSYDTYKIADNLKNKNILPEFDKNDEIIDFHRVDVEFLNTNPDAKILSLDPLSDYINYYTSNSGENGILHVKQYKKVYYQNIYPNIDLEFLIQNDVTSPFKFNFIIHPGGQINNIQFRYTGALNTKLVNEEIILHLTTGDIIENIPFAMLDDGTKVKVQYIKTGEDKYGIISEQYDTIKKMIIDPIPVMNWGTYYGNTGQENTFGIKKDNSGFVYVGGETTSITSIATSGSHQSQYGGGGWKDGFLVKFNNFGIRQWATYYGGNDYDLITGLDISNSGNVYITGITRSFNAIASISAYQISQAGDNDVFIAKFNSSGVRQWGTYLGGSNRDVSYGIVLDGGENVYVTGETRSEDGIAFGSSFQGTFGGERDAFLSKFTADGIPVWSTYLGSTGIDRAYCIAADNNSNVIIGGSTNSTDNIATPFAHQTGYGGSMADGFLSKFSSAGDLLWSTYYGGSSEEEIRGIKTDAAGNINFTGWTGSPNSIASPGSFLPQMAGAQDCFLSKMNPLGEWLWGTYIGGTDADYCSALSIDNVGNLYITGQTKSTNGISTSDSFQQNFAGGDWDAFMIKFNSNGLRSWGSYYGGPALDIGRAIYTDNLSNIYITGETRSLTGISSSVAYQTTFSGNNEESSCAFISRFSMSMTIYTVFNASICSGQSYTFNNQTFTQQGQYSFPYTSSTGGDSIVVLNLTVNPLPTMGCPSTITTCINSQAFQLNTATPAGGTYTGQGVSNNLFYPSVAGLGNKTITYTYTNLNGCTNTCSFIISVINPPQVSCPSPMTVCLQTPSFQLSGGNPSGGIYSGNGVSNGLFNPSVAGLGNHIITYTYASSSTCSNSCVFIITVKNPDPVSCPSNIDICIDASPITLSGSTPTGGLYSGAGVINGIFYPQVAGVGNHAITYLYTDNLNCTNFCTFMISVKALPVVSCPSSQISACINNAPVLLTASPLGGTYTGNGVSGNIFTPSAAGVGTHSITYMYSDSYGCSNSCNFSVKVNSIPQVSCPANVQTCVDSPPFSFSGASPSGGIYSGAGITQTIFSPFIAGVGNHTLTYTVSDNNNCTNFCNFSVLVNNKPNVVCPSNIEVCQNTAAFALSNAEPPGGLFSGPGVSNGIFNPMIAGTGIHSILYTYSDANNCSNSCSFTITVKSFPQITCPVSQNFCINQGLYTFSGYSPSDGVFSGTGVTGNTFNPSVAGLGLQNLNFSFTNSYGCSNSCSFSVQINPEPQVSCPENMNVCITSSPFFLTGGNPSGGNYSGSGVFGNKFSPGIAGEGVHEITYTYFDGNNCSKTCNFTITVQTVPSVTCISNFSLPLNAGPTQLNGVLPAGGNYSGNGVQNNVFDPISAGVGQHLISYTYSNGSCSSSCSFKIIVFDPDIVACIGSSEYCLNDAPSALFQGSPSGGIYSGTGVSNNIFNPSIAGTGTHEITYTYNNGTIFGQCTFEVQVLSLPVLQCPDDIHICLNSMPVFLPEMSSLSGSFSGIAVINNYFYPEIATPGTHSIEFTYDDSMTHCQNSCQFNIFVSPLPQVTCPSEFSVCSGNLPLELQSGTPSGGTFSGQGITNGFLYPSLLLPGDYTSIYSYTDPSTGCSNSCDFNFTVKPSTELQCPQNIQKCRNALPFTLDGALPLNGQYFGQAVENNIFYPNQSQAGNNIITYNYTNSEGCTDSCSFSIVISEPLPLTCPENIEICQFAPPFALSGGIPENGMYNGSGVVNGVFYPSSLLPETYAVTYSLVNEGNICISSCLFNVKLNELPYVFLGDDQILPNTDILVLDAGNDFNHYLWNTGDTSQSITINGIDYPENSYQFSVEVIDNNFCKNSDTILVDVIDVVGFNESSGQVEIILYPNPATNYLTIKVNCSFCKNETYLVSISNISGKIVYKDFIENFNSKSIDLHEISSGVYFIDIKSETFQKIVKFVKTH